jgi:hypothetical protein
LQKRCPFLSVANRPEKQPFPLFFPAHFTARSLFCLIKKNEESGEIKNDDSWVVRQFDPNWNHSNHDVIPNRRKAAVRNLLFVPGYPRNSN